MVQDGQRADEARTIFIIEDDENNREFLGVAITTETPYGVLLMGSCTEALARLNEVQTIKPALLLLDYRLPEMTGLEFYDCLHQTAGLENVPALLLTALPLAEEIKQALAERNISVLFKPFQLDDLLGSITQTIQFDSPLLADTRQPV